MTTVRFATKCDRCATKSREYTAWPTCRECLDDICPACDVPTERTDADLDEPATTICRDCARAESAVTAWSDQLQQADRYRRLALHFFERARSYDEIGLVRIAGELRKAARAFREASEYLGQSPLHERQAVHAAGKALGHKEQS